MSRWVSLGNRDVAKFAAGSFAIVLLTSLLVSPTCAADPPKPDKPTVAVQKPVKPIAEDPEVKQGRQAHEEMLKSGLKLIKDPKAQERIETIGKKLADVANSEVIPASFGSPNTIRYDYKFFIVDDKDVNAFSLPGGYIYVNKGLLKYCQSDDELAGVLGHEITHAAHHHVAKLEHQQSRLTSQMMLGLLAALLVRVPAEMTANLFQVGQLLAVQKINGHSQNAERDADHGGVEIVRKAGYNPVGALTFMERLAADERNRPEVDLGIYRTHPPSKERAEALITQIKSDGLPINRRSVTNVLKVTTKTVPATGNDGGSYDLLLDDKLLYRSTSSERIQTAAKSLNMVLDNDLQIYDITKQGGNLLVHGETVIAFDTNEAALLGATVTPDKAADQAYRALRYALFRQLLDGNGALTTGTARGNDK